MAKAKPAEGVLRGGVVIVADPAQANRLYNRGWLGEPQAGNSLRLSHVEAAWAIGHGRLVVDVAGADLTVADILGAALPNAAESQSEFFAYSDLRERGLTVRHAPSGLAAWPRGVGIQGPPAYIVRPASENDACSGLALIEWAKAGLVLGVVDGDGVVTHYRLGLHSPTGTCLPTTLPTLVGKLLHAGVLIPGPAGGHPEHEAAMLGTPGPGGLYLSFAEADWLLRRGLLSGIDEFAAEARNGRAAFAQVAAVYSALRNAGVVPKSGFKFGTQLRCYASDAASTHATWLVECVGPTDLVPWSRLSMGVRMAHGVRKSFLVAVANGGAVQFAELTWFKP